MKRIKKSELLLFTLTFSLIPFIPFIPCEFSTPSLSVYSANPA